MLSTALTLWRSRSLWRHLRGSPGHSTGLLHHQSGLISPLGEIQNAQTGTPATAGAQEQATSFAITPAGPGGFHVNVVSRNPDCLRTIPTI
ncbi:hypothetical protein BD779DRAFT_1807221 [Infundibulicybe gibba]|nr:hypothetical protein BD779DRAFT_1807221 [Infundibulicybe gibba]